MGICIFVFFCDRLYVVVRFLFELLQNQPSLALSIVHSVDALLCVCFYAQRAGIAVGRRIRL
jgi:hypothetical protein